MKIEEVLYRYKNAYYSFPQSLKTFLGEIYGHFPLKIRYGYNFVNHTKIIDIFENATEQYQLDFIYNKTLQTLIFAENNLPFYKKLFQEYNISSKNFKDISDLKLFPTISKKDVKQEIVNMYSDLKEKPVAYYSGGSLSTPTKFFLPASSRAKERAYTNYIFSKVGYQYRDKTLVIRGREIANVSKNIFWDFDPIDNFLFLSNNYINSDVFPLIHDEALQFKGKFLYGYPSAILSFIKQSQKFGLEKVEVQAVILSSETTYPHELDIIHKYFNTDVLIHYGHTERATIAYKVNNEKYNFLNSYGVTRVKDSEIIATTFDNFVMPLINYKTEDFVSGKIDYIDHSDLISSTENIEGRTKDFLVTQDKRLVSITTMCGGQHLPLESMDAIQYIQNEIGHVTVLVEGHHIDQEKVRAGMCKLVREGIKFDVKKVEKIEKSTRGKRIICKQSLNIEDIRNKHVI